MIDLNSLDVLLVQYTVLHTRVSTTQAEMLKSRNSVDVSALNINLRCDTTATMDFF